MPATRIDPYRVECEVSKHLIFGDNPNDAKITAPLRVGLKLNDEFDSEGVQLFKSSILWPTEPAYLHLIEAPTLTGLNGLQHLVIPISSQFTIQASVIYPRNWFSHADTQLHIWLKHEQSEEQMLLDFLVPA